MSGVATTVAHARDAEIDELDDGGLDTSNPTRWSSPGAGSTPAIQWSTLLGVRRFFFCSLL